MFNNYLFLKRVYNMNKRGDEVQVKTKNRDIPRGSMKNCFPPVASIYSLRDTHQTTNSAFPLSHLSVVDRPPTTHTDYSHLRPLPTTYTDHSHLRPLPSSTECGHLNSVYPGSWRLRFPGLGCMQVINGHARSKEVRILNNPPIL